MPHILVRVGEIPFSTRQDIILMDNCQGIRDKCNGVNGGKVWTNGLN